MEFQLKRTRDYQLEVAPSNELSLLLDGPLYSDFKRLELSALKAFLAIPPQYVHPAKVWEDKAVLSGATVISNLTIDSLGHPTGWTTRELTPSDIGVISDHTGLSNIGINTHAQIDSFISSKGSANGLASLDAQGFVLNTQLPSYVDDVLEYANLAAFPVTGESGKIYVAIDTNKTYRWSGTIYVVISDSLVLGETSTTAYRGDRGKIAYDHSQAAHAPSDANNYIHPAKTWVNKTTLSGATVISNLTIDALGHPIDWTTRTLTPESIGAEPANANIQAHISATNIHFTQAQISITESQISDLKAYLTSQISHADVVVDGDFTSQGIMLRGATSGTYSILTNNSGSWNTAFEWGNHAGLYSLLAHTHTFASLTSKPTTLAGYGITDAQASDADLTAIAALAGTTGLLRKTAANTWSLDTSAYLTSFTETDPFFTAWNKSTGISITESQISDLKAYLTSQISHADVLVDGDFASQGIMLRGATSGTYSILTNSSSNWNTAYDWGNHAGLYSLLAHTHTFASLTSKPTTLAGYGITDAQALDADLTAIAALAGTTGLLRKTAANTWSLDTSAYLTSFTETDPVFTAWNKSTGISITESQISDLKTYLLDTTDTFTGTLTLIGALSSTSTAPFQFVGNGNTGTYTQTQIYVSQNNTSGHTQNGIFIERGYLAEDMAELRQFVIGARGGSIQWRLDGVGNSYQTGGVSSLGFKLSTYWSANNSALIDYGGFGNLNHKIYFNNDTLDTYFDYFDKFTLRDSHSSFASRLSISNTGAATFGYTINTSYQVNAGSFSDGYITWAGAQLNRYSSNIELQFTPTAGSTVRIGANGSFPTTFNAYTGTFTNYGKISALGGDVQIGNYNDITALTMAASGNGTSRINFYDGNTTEGCYIRSVGSSGGAQLYFGSRWNTDSDKIHFDLVDGTVEFFNLVTLGNNLRINPGQFIETAFSGIRRLFGADATGHAFTIIRSIDNDAGDGIQFQNSAGSQIALIENSGNFTTTTITAGTSITAPLINPTNVSYLYFPVQYATGLGTSNLRQDSFGQIVSSTTMVATNFLATSDRRLKANIKPLSANLAYLLNPVFYTRKDGSEKGVQVGFIAQDVQKVHVSLVHEGSDGILGLAYAKVTSLLSAGVNDLNTRVIKVENTITEVAQLKLKVSELEQELNKLKN